MLKDEDSSIQINNKPESVVTDRGLKMFTVEHREKRVKILQ